MLSEALMNLSAPVFSVNKNGIITAKNRATDINIPVIKIGATASRYIDADFSIDRLSKGTICDMPCTYFTLVRDDCTLVFISFATFGEDFLPFDVFELYKQRISEAENSRVIDNSIEKRYVRAVHNNLVRSNFFSYFSALFNNSIKVRHGEEVGKVLLSKVCEGINSAITNFFDDFKIHFNVDYNSSFISNINERDFVCLILNSLMFCVTNAIGDVEVTLSNDLKYSKLSFTYESYQMFDRLLQEKDNCILNSALSVMIAFRLAELNGIKYSLIRVPAVSSKKHSKNTIEFLIPGKVNTFITFADHSNLNSLITKYLYYIFLDEKI